MLNSDLTKQQTPHPNKIIIFGVGKWGLDCYEQVITQSDHVIAFLDNDIKKQGTSIMGVPVLNPRDIATIEADQILIAISNPNSVAQVQSQLKELGVSEDKISPFVFDRLIKKYDKANIVRTNWVKSFARHVYDNGIAGNIAECGVFRGIFARHLNRFFYDKKLYLFDTFAGFDDRDVRAEPRLTSWYREGAFSSTSVDSVMSLMQYPENCVVKQGWFPETAKDVQDTFCFVNLDMDLYQPILAGLQFFLEKMSSGGVILIHDYYEYDQLPGVKQAVADFETSINKTLTKIPIGNDSSIAIIKC